MIVPQYWAEGRVPHRKPGKQITVRRFGWSDTSQEEAQAYSARKLIATIGSQQVHPEAGRVLELNDTLCRALRDLPLS